MEQLEATKALNAALAEAQGEFPTIGREKTVEDRHLHVQLRRARHHHRRRPARPRQTRIGDQPAARAQRHRPRPPHRTPAQRRRHHHHHLPAHPSPRIAATARVAAHLPPPLRHHRPTRASPPRTTTTPAKPRPNRHSSKHPRNQQPPADCPSPNHKRKRSICSATS